MAQHVVIKHDSEYMDYPSRTADPEWAKVWTGGYAYPAPVALWSAPKGGDTAHVILEWNWLLVKEVNTRLAWAAAKRNNAGWINWAHTHNKVWAQGEVLPDKPEPMPKIEGITSIGAKHRVLEVRNNSARIEAYNPKQIIPAHHSPESHPHLWVHFRSIDENGNLGNAPNGREFYFPIFADRRTGEAWIPLEKAHLKSGEPIFDVSPPAPEPEPVPVKETPKVTINPLPISLHGKGMYIWKLDRNGKMPEVDTLAQMAKDAGLTHVLIKVANGIHGYNEDKIDDAVAAFREMGIKVWGWHYIYSFAYPDKGYSSSQIADYRQKQIDRAISEATNLKLDGFVINAEKEWKYTGADIPARQYAKSLRMALRGLQIPIGFSSFRYPSLHRPLPFEVFLEYSDVNMPQVYWQSNDNPEAQLQRTLREYGNLTIQRPIFPTGAAYGEWGWRAKPDEVHRFMLEAVATDRAGVNFWEWYEAAEEFNGELWNVIRDFDYPAPELEKPTAYQRFRCWIDHIKERQY